MPGHHPERGPDRRRDGLERGGGGSLGRHGRAAGGAGRGGPRPRRAHGAEGAEPAASLTVERTENRPPLVRNEAVAGLYEHARKEAAELGVDLPEGGTGGGSDGSIAAAEGAAVLDGLGAQGDGAHAIHEHIVLSDLPFRLALMAR
jgi:acetylornithine deacetylase/succinyl-diaminopimelate desuccinylase-like protein